MFMICTKNNRTLKAVQLLNAENDRTFILFVEQDLDRLCALCDDSKCIHSMVKSIVP